MQCTFFVKAEERQREGDMLNIVSLSEMWVRLVQSMTTDSAAGVCGDMFLPVLSPLSYFGVAWGQRFRADPLGLFWIVVQFFLEILHNCIFRDICSKQRAKISNGELVDNSATDYKLHQVQKKTYPDPT